MARGLEQGYNLDYPEALQSFQHAVDVDPQSSTAHRLFAATAWIALLFDQGAVTIDDYLGQAGSDVERRSADPARLRTLRLHLDRAMALAEMQVEARPADPEAHYLVGAASGLQASLTSTIEGRVMGGLGPARRAYREHQRTLTLDSTRKDAGLIVGLYAYGIGELSAPMRLIAKLAGFSGEKETAVRRVEEAAAFPSDAQPGARFTLILIYNREHRYADALRVIERLRAEYPKNRLLWLEAASTLLRAGRFAEAKGAIEQGLRQLQADPRPRAYGEESRWHYVHGAALVPLGESEAASRALQAAISTATRDWIRGRAEKERGKLFDLAGNRANAIAAYRTAKRYCHNDHDGDCEEEVALLLTRPYRVASRLPDSEGK